MQNLSMCRICLATDVRLCSVARSLQDMYEKLTELTFKREDRRPLVACYICHARLQNCYRLRTSCLQSDELLTEMLSSGELVPQQVSSTNTLRAVSVLHFSLGHVHQDTAQCHVKEEAPEVIHDIELDHQNTEDAEYINLEDENIKIEEIGWEPDIISWEPDIISWAPDIASPSLQFADNILCPKILKVVLERIDLHDSRVGARVSKKPTIAAMQDTEDATTNERKIEVIENERTEAITIKETKMVTKKIEVDKPVTTSKILETSEMVDNYLNKCDDNVLTSVINDVCEQKSTNNTSLEQNFSSFSSSKAKPFSCDTCNKYFSYKHHLKIHIRTHSGEKPYQCNVCKKYFNVKENLKTHIRTHTGEKPYQCHVCKKCFSQKGHYKTHIRTHSGEKPYQCNVCNQCFSYKHNLKTHILTHSDDKPFQCKICSKRFILKGHFKSHLRTHSGEKPYQCNVCKKCFSYKHNLKSHVRTHSGEKPYQCNVCKMCFIQKGNLKTHIRKHSGEKPYHCNVCKKCFSDFGNYLKHVRIHKR